MADFNQVVSLPVFAPFKESEDKGADGTYAVFSNGPYQLKAAWDPSSGGTFVRNPKWDKGSDPIRQAKPASIDYVEGTESQTAVQQVINDDEGHRQSVTLDSAPPAMQQHVLSDAALKARSVNPFGTVRGLPRAERRKGVMRNPKVRAGPGARHQPRGLRHRPGRARAPPAAAYSLIGPALPGHTDDDPWAPVPRATPRAARAALQESGLTLPVKITVAYRSTPTADKAMAALAERLGGRRLRRDLQPVAKDYFADGRQARAARPTTSSGRTGRPPGRPRPR